MAFRRIVVIGASSGGIETLRALVSALPSDFAAPICVVMHMAPQSPGVLHEILRRAGRLDAVSPKNGERLRPGTIYVAPPDFHLIVEPGELRLTRGPKENRFRPAIDPLFRSAAQSYGPGAVGVILTGNLGDGTAGLSAIKQLGGTTIVQDPRDALFPSMPESAIAHVAVDYVIPVADIPALLTTIAESHPDARREEVPLLMDVENKIAKEVDPLATDFTKIARPSRFACPECHGVLHELVGTTPLRFRCHTGHAYSIESLLAAVNQAVEESMWNSIRALHEAAMLLESVCAKLRQDHPQDRYRELERRARETRAQADEIRKLIDSKEALTSSQ
jgi:two-component system, chemotaxis family, protein-glutamate methylesterase/glutaminase